MKPDKILRLRKILEETEIEFLKKREIDSDAITPALKYKNSKDKEFAALICAVLAYGKVEHIKKSVRRLLDPLGDEPVQFLLSVNEKKIAKLMEGWKHRFNTTSDAVHLLLLLKSIYQTEGSIESFAHGRLVKFETINKIVAKDLLENFVIHVEGRLRELKIKPNKSFWFFFSKPSSGSACKRLNLYLRWMVGTGPFDLGLWKSISEKQLMIPLDVHILNQARSLKMTRRKQADWKTVEEVTEKLKLLDKDNPTRFDFALCHLGINGKILASLMAIFLFGCQAPPKSGEAILKAPVVVTKAKFTQQDEVRFLRAIKDDDANQVHFFISMGIDLNKTFKFPGSERETALSAAIDSRSRKSLRLILDSGAKPDALDDPNNSELISAILSRQDLVALELLDKGSIVDKTLKESGETALMSASRIGMCSVTQRLVEHGARVDLQNDDGYTALMYATEYGHIPCIESLLTVKADVHLRNKAGRTAKVLASEKLSAELKNRL